LEKLAELNERIAQPAEAVRAMLGQSSGSGGFVAVADLRVAPKAWFAAVSYSVPLYSSRNCAISFSISGSAHRVARRAGDAGGIYIVGWQFRRTG